MPNHRTPHRANQVPAANPLVRPATSANHHTANPADSAPVTSRSQAHQGISVDHRRMRSARSAPASSVRAANHTVRLASSASRHTANPADSAPATTRSQGHQGNSVDRRRMRLASSGRVGTHRAAGPDSRWPVELRGRIRLV
ncbi:hypothetical protein ATM97_27105 [Nocardia sp. MH4]|nr:hypothetical protein [Nocardia sp. MH4]